MEHKTFNIILSGVGGQGIITLLQILAEAAFVEKYDVKTSELHGLSQRGGSVVAHLRFGEKIFSPLIKATEADLILSLEISEAVRARATSVPFSPPACRILLMISSTGPPGTNWISVKQTREIPIRVGTISNRRRRI